MRQVEQLASGKYKVRFRYAGRQSSESFDRKSEAQKFAKMLDALGTQGALDWLATTDWTQADEVPSLDQVAADHIALLTGVEEGTRKTYTRLWARTWSPLLGGSPVDQLSRDDVARAVNVLARTYSHKSLQNQRGLLSGVLDRVVALGHLPRNPAKGLRVPRGQEGDRTEMRVLTAEEYASIIERIPDHYRPAVNFLAGTGCRWGEMVALMVADVQLPNVRIRRALKWSPDGGRQVGATKTRRSNRTVVLPTLLQEEVGALCAGRDRADLVFTATQGGPIHHRTFWSRVWLPAVSHLEPRPRIHDLRHSHASTLLAAGVPIHVVQARLGHESIQTTVDTYGHLLPDAQVAAAAAADLALGYTPALG